MKKTLVILVLSQPWMALGANSWWTWDHDPYDPSFCYSDENFNVTMIRNFLGYISNDLVHHQLLNHKSNQLDDISFWCIWFIWPRTQQPKSLNLFPLYRMPVLGHVTFDLMIYPWSETARAPIFPWADHSSCLVWHFYLSFGSWCPPEKSRVQRSFNIMVSKIKPYMIFENTILWVFL